MPGFFFGTFSYYFSRSLYFLAGLSVVCSGCTSDDGLLPATSGSSLKEVEEIQEWYRCDTHRESTASTSEGVLPSAVSTTTKLLPPWQVFRFRKPTSEEFTEMNNPGMLQHPVCNNGFGSSSGACMMPDEDVMRMVEQACSQWAQASNLKCERVSDDLPDAFGSPLPVIIFKSSHNNSGATGGSWRYTGIEPTPSEKHRKILRTSSSQVFGLGLTLHELGHAIYGFEHEHNRFDKMRYIVPDPSARTQSFDGSGPRFVRDCLTSPEIASTRDCVRYFSTQDIQGWSTRRSHRGPFLPFDLDSTMMYSVTNQVTKASPSSGFSQVPLWYEDTFVGSELVPTWVMVTTAPKMNKAPWCNNARLSGEAWDQIGRRNHLSLYDRYAAAIRRLGFASFQPGDERLITDQHPDYGIYSGGCNGNGQDDVNFTSRRGRYLMRLNFQNHDALYLTARLPCQSTQSQVDARPFVRFGLHAVSSSDAGFPSNTQEAGLATPPDETNPLPKVFGVKIPGEDDTTTIGFVNNGLEIPSDPLRADTNWRLASDATLGSSSSISIRINRPAIEGPGGLTYYLVVEAFLPYRNLELQLHPAWMPPGEIEACQGQAPEGRTKVYVPFIVR